MTAVVPSLLGSTNRGRRYPLSWCRTPLPTATLYALRQAPPPTPTPAFEDDAADDDVVMVDSDAEESGFIKVVIVVEPFAEPSVGTGGSPMPRPDGPSHAICHSSSERGGRRY